MSFNGRQSITHNHWIIATKWLPLFNFRWFNGIEGNTMIACHSLFDNYSLPLDHCHCMSAVKWLAIIKWHWMKHNDWLPSIEWHLFTAIESLPLNAFNGNDSMAVNDCQSMDGKQSFCFFQCHLMIANQLMAVTQWPRFSGSGYLSVNG